MKRGKNDSAARNTGFTLIELLIVVAIIAVIASIAIPNLLSARLQSNESRAIASLRSIASAQAQIKTQAIIDQDQDGIGEYAWEGELAGLIGLRDDTGAVSALILDPALMRFNSVLSSHEMGFYLPGPGGAPLTSVGGGTPGGEDPDLCEQFFLVYLWPRRLSQTGRRVFATNQTFEILQSDNQDPAQLYDGVANPPAFDAALTAPDMRAPFSLNGVPGPAGDGAVWLVVN